MTRMFNKVYGGRLLSGVRAGILHQYMRKRHVQLCVHPRALILLLLGGLPLVGVQAADNDSLSAPGISLWTVAADGQGKASIGIALNGGRPVAAVQFDIRYPNATMDFSLSPTSILISAGKTIYVSSPQPAWKRIVIVGLNQNLIDHGVIATLSAQVRAGTAPGIYPLLVDNAIASDALGDGVSLAFDPGGVVVAGDGVPVPVVLGVGNAASYASGGVAPGEIVVIGGYTLGPEMLANPQVTSEGLLATSVGGTRVLFDDIPAPLLYSSQQQTSAIVPYQLTEGRQTSLQVEYQGVRSTPFVIAATKTFPAIFTTNQSGTGPGAIVNQDGTINTPANPAPKGSIVSVYCTGEGQTEPQGIDGSFVGVSDLRRPLEPVSASIGDQAAEVIYAGSAGNQVSGLFQVNLLIPAAAISAPALPLTIHVGESTQPGVTIAVR